MNNKLIFISIISFILLTIISITLFNYSTPLKIEKIREADIEAMLFAESLTGKFKVKEAEKVMLFKNDIDLNIDYYCEPTEPTESNNKNTIRLKIESNKGYYMYEVTNNLIKKLYQPNLRHQLAKEGIDIVYACEKETIEKYKEKLKKLIK